MPQTRIVDGDQDAAFSRSREFPPRASNRADLAGRPSIALDSSVPNDLVYLVLMATGRS